MPFIISSAACPLWQLPPVLACNGAISPTPARHAQRMRVVMPFLLCRNRRHQRLQKFMRHAEAALVLLREIPLAVRRIKELVLVLDVPAPLVSRFRQHREKPFPIHRAVAGPPEAPPARAIHRLDARPPPHVPENLRVLRSEEHTSE